VLNGSGFPREDNIQHLIEQGYRYLVVSRKRKRSFDEEQAVAVKTAQGQPVKVQRVVNPQTGEAELQKLADGLHKKTPPNAMTRYWNGWAE